MQTLVCNAGSSSLKCSLFEAEGELLLAEGGYASGLLGVSGGLV